MIVDVQKAIDDPGWGNDRNNPDCENNIARLLEEWRARRWPVFHIRHLSLEPLSTYKAHPEFKDEVAPLPNERVIDKSTNSAFIGTTLEHELRELGIQTVVITGVITNNSVEATARMSGNLGFDTIVVSDATATFGKRDYDGRWRTSAEVHAMSLANMEGEYASIRTTNEVLTDPCPPSSRCSPIGRDAPPGSSRPNDR